jgi:hypothetical protein
MRNSYKILVEKFDGKRPLRRIRPRFEGDVRNRVLGGGLGASRSGQRPVAGCCEHSNYHSSSIKGGGIS